MGVDGLGTQSGSRRDSKSGRSIVFLHIPKAAGTTLHRIIERQYPPATLLTFGADAQGSVRKFKELPEARRAEIQVLKGHMAFGLHEFFPQHATYITILRDPIERTISYYYHILRNPTHYLYQRVVPQELSIEEVVCGEMTPDLDNGQTRLLSGVWNDVPCGRCTSDMLEQAKRNLRDHFAIVGLAERFDETLLLLRRVFQWRWRGLFYVRANVTPNRPRRDRFPHSTLESLRKYNELDIELYEYAQGLFEEQAGRYRRSLAMELAFFRLVNKLMVLGLVNKVCNSTQNQKRRWMK